jgi:two-component system OmpR family sensor kinase
MKSDMRIKASELSSAVIYARMNHKEFSFNQALKSNIYKVGFYNNLKIPIASNISKIVDFSRYYYQDGGSMILIDNSAFGHLEVESIVLQRDNIFKFTNLLRYNIIAMLIFSYFIISIIGYFLAKLFIRPIQMKRIKLDNFIKDSTHELNTPISALLLSINSPMLHNSKNIERIKILASRISQIHQDLTYLLLDNTKIKNIESIELNSIIYEQLEYLSLLALKRGVTIEVSNSNIIYFNILEDDFIRLFNNLITNAIKYNRQNGRVEIIIQDSQITIKDTGIGVAKDNQKEIYQRFYRASNEVGGFGIGLNIVNKICKEYNIKIYMESILGRGSSFVLKF